MLCNATKRSYGGLACVSTNGKKMEDRCPSGKCEANVRVAS